MTDQNHVSRLGYRREGARRHPNVRLLRIEPITAERWDGLSNGVVATFEFAKTRSQTRSHMRMFRCVTVGRGKKGFHNGD